MMNMEFLLLISSKKFFRMFELKQIMRQRDSKVSAKMLNRLRDGTQTTENINNFEEKTIANYRNLQITCSINRRLV